MNIYSLTEYILNVEDVYIDYTMFYSLDVNLIL